jgi:hypothetical protein
MGVCDCDAQAAGDRKTSDSAAAPSSCKSVHKIDEAQAAGDRKTSDPAAAPFSCKSVHMIDEAADNDGIVDDEVYELVDSDSDDDLEHGLVDESIHGTTNGGCVSFHEPNSAYVEQRRILREAIGADRVKMLESLDMMDELEKRLLVDRSLLPVTIEENDILPFDSEEWIDQWIELTLDSGCCEHVLDLTDAPGHANFITTSMGSRRGQNFVVGNGQKVPNEGEINLNMECEGVPLQSTFQVAEITRPLMSVGRVCDQGLTCTFDKEKAVITDKDKAVLCTFARAGGLYVARLKLKSPELFARQAR